MHPFWVLAKSLCSGCPPENHALYPIPLQIMISEQSLRDKGCLTASWGFRVNITYLFSPSILYED